MLLRGLIGMVLRRIRLGQNRTLRDVAEAARVSVPYLSEVERGRKEPSSELLAAICSALDLELIDLLSEVRMEIAANRQAQLPLHGRSVTSTTSIRSEPLSPSALQGQVSVGFPSDAFAGSFGSLGSVGSVMVAA
jgi:transcriptional regulator with XRE-family HTH domain